MMSNKMVAVQADKARNLKFNYKALMTLEEDFGIKLSDLEGADFFTLKRIKTLTYCGFLHEAPDLTMEEMDEIMDAMMEINGFEGMVEKIMEAFMKAFGVDEGTMKQAKNQAKKQVAGSKK